MIKYCPIMSFQKEYHSEEKCMEDSCGMWDEERNQCCFKTQALAAAAKPPVTPVVFQSSYDTSPKEIDYTRTGEYVDPMPCKIINQSNKMSVSEFVKNQTIFPTEERVAFI
jgi:hypothetical protein